MGRPHPRLRYACKSKGWAPAPSKNQVGFVSTEGPSNVVSVVISAPSREATGTFSVVFFAATMFLSAFLLFSVEPMVAKMILPLLGGTAAVWNTCLVFFQAVLLAGYVYAHESARLLSLRRQMVLHLSVLLLALVVLPLQLPAAWAPPVRQNPALWLLVLLSVTVGLPFFVLSASTPILQKWFSHSDAPAASDPYFLYVASNAGSMAGLLSYPFVLEPTLHLSTQRRLWSYGYVLLLLLAGGCVALIWRGARRLTQPAERTQDDAVPDAIGEDLRPAVKRRLRWVVLAFVPASLTLGVTTALTTDMPAIPLFWVLPLAVYLLSFVLVFARQPRVSHDWMIRRLPLLILAAVFPIVSGARLPILLWIPLDLLALFGVAMVCHGELTRDRPSTKHLTEFYLWISVGGVLGGTFNALIAPVLFHSVIEFPLVLVLAALLRPAIDVKENTPRARWLDLLLPVILGLLLLSVVLILQAFGREPVLWMSILLFGLALEWCLSFNRRPIRFAAGLTAIFLAGTVYTGSSSHIVHKERSFFGVYRVTDDDQKQFRRLVHGATVHGIQSLDPAKAREQAGYYTKDGPIGQVFDAFSGNADMNQVAIVGLGTGSMTCYVTLPQQLTYYEIDPAVERIARDPKYFTFLRNCNPQVPVVLGDARLSLEAAPNHSYGIIIIDAFSGDAIPVHLLTREALQLYLRKLTPNGIVVFHLSNNYLDLEPVVASLAGDAGLICLIERDLRISAARRKNGAFPSIWAVVGRNASDLGKLAADPRWKRSLGKPGSQVWTDDFSSVIRIFRWK
jgi:SAM-dependent methyltransferase